MCSFMFNLLYKSWTVYLFEGVLKKLQELQQALDQAKLKAKILDWMQKNIVKD